MGGMTDPLAGLDFEIDEPVDVIDVTRLSPIELARLESDTRDELNAGGEMHVPADSRSDRGKELHSRFIACQIERRRRG
jgi:hypothetical protein